MTDALTGNLIHFSRYLRARGLSVVPQTSADLLAAANVVGLANRSDLYSAFRAVTVVRPEDLTVFDAAFNTFFALDPTDELKPPELIEINVHDRDRHRVAVPVMANHDVADPDGDDDVSQQLGASDVDRLGRKDFGDLTPEEQAEVRQLIARMVWQPADAASRRWASSRSGTKPDFRRTFRRAVGPDGDLMPLAYSDKRPRKRPLLVLADVSGSMERYSEMLLYFIHAAQGRLGRVEAFVFSTRLTRITREVRHRDPRVALHQVGSAVQDWSGGTRIGDALAHFNRKWARRVTRGGPIALIISDGWDRGEPELLRVEMGRLARSVRRVIWLNPLAGRPGYRPATRGMQAVLPFVDNLLSAASVSDLRDVVRLLESVPARRREVVRL